jgi:hypothetical protein
VVPLIDSPEFSPLAVQKPEVSVLEESRLKSSDDAVVSDVTVFTRHSDMLQLAVASTIDTATNPSDFSGSHKRVNTFFT